MNFISVSNQLELAGVVLLAGLLGGILGIERERVGKAAGMRTHAAVAIAAAVAVGLSQLLITEAGTGDVTRGIHGVFTGIGFIGLGAMASVHGRTTGITTAASILVAAMLGAACAAGAPLLAVLVTLLVWVTLRFRHRLHRLVVSGAPKGQASNADDDM